MSLGIYRIVNTVTNRTYIGSSVTVEHRLRGHRRSLQRNDHINRHLQASWNKHGDVAFIFEPLVECEETSLTVKEQAFIDAYHENELPLFNLTKSADSRTGFRYKPTAEAVAKFSASLKGRIFSAATRAKISEAGRGRVISQECRAKLRAANLGKKLTPGHRTNIGVAFRGKPLSPEHRAKLSAVQKGRKFSVERMATYVSAMKGRKHTLETRQKMRASHMGHPVSDESRRKMSEARKRWYVQFNHIVEAVPV